MPDNNNTNSENVNSNHEVHDTNETKTDENGQKQPGKVLIDMNKAIEILKTSRPTFYRWLRSGKIKGMKIGRQWRFYREDIDRFLKGEKPVIDLPAAISPFIEALIEELSRSGMKYSPPKSITPDGWL